LLAGCLALIAGTSSVAGQPSSIHCWMKRMSELETRCPPHINGGNCVPSNGKMPFSPLIKPDAAPRPGERIDAEPLIDIALVFDEPQHDSCGAGVPDGALSALASGASCPPAPAASSPPIP